MAVDGNAKFQALNISSKIPCLAGLLKRRIFQDFQALKFPNSGAEMWRIHPPPFHTPPFACLFGGGGA